MARINKEIVYPELSYRINGLCYQVHNKIGRFCREKQYGNELEKLLKENSITYQREYKLDKLSEEAGGNIVDFFIEGKLLVDLKAKKFITKEDYYQMLRYLQSSGLKLGLIINFRNTYLKPKRIINLSHS